MCVEKVNELNKLITLFKCCTYIFEYERNTFNLLTKVLLHDPWENYFKELFNEFFLAEVHTPLSQSPIGRAVNFWTFTQEPRLCSPTMSMFSLRECGGPSNVS